MKNSFIRTWRLKLKKWLTKDNDELLWNTLTVVSLLAVLIMIFWIPKCARPTPKIPAPPPALSPAPPEPIKVHKPKRRKTQQVFMRTRPEQQLWPAPTVTPSVPPTPVPPGGGYRTIVFASNRADGRYYQLYSMDSNGSNLKRLTFSRAFDRDPHFSYDGQKVAFCSNRGGGAYQIYVLELDSLKVRQLTASRGDKTNPIWFPDNSKLFFTFVDDGAMKIMQINADGTGLQQKMRTKMESQGCKNLYSISPDGRLLAYQSDNKKSNEIAIYNLETNETKTLMESNDLASYRNPVFSPNGWQLMFTADFMEHRINELYIFDVVHGTHERMIRDGVDRDDSVFSPDGKLIAYTAKWEDAWNIWVMNADGTNTRNLTQSHYDNVVPTWR